MTLRESRKQTLQIHGARDGVVDELLAYNSAYAEAERVPARLPLPDEDFASTWACYAATAVPGQLFSFLRDRLVQLNFPIEVGISQSPVYRAATLRGNFPDTNTAFGLVLDHPEELRLDLHWTSAGRIPILFTPERADFIALVRALSMRNEPGQIADSMGACLVSGYNNWDRVRAYRADWEKQLPHNRAHREWNLAFESLAKAKHLYQDKFILLSGGFYSAVTPDQIGLDEEAWRAASLVIRREHESAHYLTRRLFASNRNNLLDEIVADYAGIISAAGEYRQDWALLFLGLESFPYYRAGARLENYRGMPPLSDAAVAVLQSLVRAAVFSIHSYCSRCSGENLAKVIIRLTQLTLEEVAEGRMETRKGEIE